MRSMQDEVLHLRPHDSAVYTLTSLLDAEGNFLTPPLNIKLKTLGVKPPSDAEDTKQAALQAKGLHLVYNPGEI